MFHRLLAFDDGGVSFRLIVARRDGDGILIIRPDNEK
jgi:hypothetical protein